MRNIAQDAFRDRHLGSDICRDGLIVDDSPEDLALYQRLFTRHSEHVYAFVETGSGAEGLALCQTMSPDCVLLDYFLPDLNGLDFLAVLGDETHVLPVPVVMLTGQGNEMVALQRTIEAQRLALLQLARVDALTGLSNRRYFPECLLQEFQRAARYGLPLGLVVLDLDHFKQINDTYGHLTGDRVLAPVGSRLRDAVRTPDLLGRYGGEEFCVALPHTPLDQAHRVAERIRQSFTAERFALPNNLTLEVTCSLGLCAFDPGMPDVEVLLRRADNALYTAKALERNRVVVASDETTLREGGP